MSDQPRHALPLTEAPSGDHPSETPLWLILGGVGLILVGLVAVGLVAVNQLKPEAGPSYPAHWDARVAPYAKIAEKERGLTFMHPVAVKFLPAKPFEKTVTTDEKLLKPKARKRLEQYAGLMRALGLLRGDVDLFKASNDVSGAGIAAYYSSATKSITIRGERVTPAIRATLVHELTHVLQDQHFAIGTRQVALAKRAAKTHDDAESSVFDAIVEGDATRVAALYQASLPARKRKAVVAEQKSAGTHAVSRMKKNQVPPVLITLETAPYTLGEALVQAAAADGGNAAVDTLFRDAPTEETALLDPLKGISDRRAATQVDTPRLERGEKLLSASDTGEFGVLSWYLMLSERVPVKQALAAADGWGGDRYVGFTRAGSSCAAINYTGRSSADTARMLTALQHWVAAAPGSPAKVGLERGLVRFESCDPGRNANFGQDASGKAVDLVATRTYLGISLLRSGATEKRARCVAGRLAVNYSVAQLNDPKFATHSPAELARVRRLTATCR